MLSGINRVGPRGGRPERAADSIRAVRARAVARAAACGALERGSDAPRVEYAHRDGARGLSLCGALSAWMFRLVRGEGSYDTLVAMWFMGWVRSRIICQNNRSRARETRTAHFRT